MRAGNVRWYMTGGGRRQQNNNLWSIVPVWARPAIYMAGSTALIIIAWPVLRFVVIGGLAYGAYKLVSLWRMWRQAVNWATSGGMGGSMQLELVEDIRKEAQACLLASCVNGDSLVLEMIPDSVADDDYEKAIELGSAVDMQTIEEEGTPQMLAGLAGRIKAVFPVVINGRRSELFVAASAKFGSARLELDAVSIYTRLGPSGQIVETKIDTSAAAGREGSRPKGSGRRHKREARDADYKEL
ncbi:hypothetical protein H4S06_000145 [Coemansia sp. BCRC 34490]|nr:hypothetical protein H4S06_000145 [Coemansia sp. BCRC 34490]